MRLVLASNSPRRKELLSQLNYEFDVIPSNCAEISTAAAPLDMVKELALRKAMGVYSSNKDAVVIGCDTVVDLNGKVLGKPHSTEQATEMLSFLSGMAHNVHTGVCVASRQGFWLFCVTTTVKFKRLANEQIRAYVDTGSPMDKAGAYGIQDSDFVQAIDGSYTNVMGFPLDEIDEILKQIYKR